MLPRCPPSRRTTDSLFRWPPHFGPLQPRQCGNLRLRGLCVSFRRQSHRPYARPANLRSSIVACKVCGAGVTAGSAQTICGGGASNNSSSSSAPSPTNAPSTSSSASSTSSTNSTSSSSAPASSGTSFTLNPCQQYFVDALSELIPFADLGRPAVQCLSDWRNDNDQFNTCADACICNIPQVQELCNAQIVDCKTLCAVRNAPDSCVDLLNTAVWDALDVLAPGESQLKWILKIDALVLLILEAARCLKSPYVV